MPHLARVTRDGITPEITRPDAAKVISGDPVHTTWNIEERGSLFCGLWQSTPGKWQVSYAEWEYVHILSGHSILTDATGTATPCAPATATSSAPDFPAHGRCWRPPSRITSSSPDRPQPS